jgi:hypothetical protein
MVSLPQKLLSPKRHKIVTGVWMFIGHGFGHEFGHVFGHGFGHGFCIIHVLVKLATPYRHRSPSMS